MKRDEFNSIKVTNESRPKGTFEFGNTQKNEFTFFKDNKSTLGKDELNSSSTKNNENIKAEKPHKKDDDLLKKSLENNQTATTVSSSSGGAVTSTGASAATTASTAVSGVVVGATVVAVTAISGLVGISALSNNNAYIDNQDFYIGDTYISYFVELKDSNGTEFRIWIENNNYSAYRALEEGGNEGNFEELTPNETYTVSIKEESDNGKVIYQSRFTTKEAEDVPPVVEPSFNGVLAGETNNYQDYTFGIILDFVEPEPGYFSDFELLLVDTADDTKKKTFTLSATTDEQILDGKQYFEEGGTVISDQQDYEIMIDIRESEFNVFLSYKENGENRSYESTTPINFTKNGTMRSEMLAEPVVATADFIKYEIYVDVYFVDDFGDFTDGYIVIGDPSGIQTVSSSIDLTVERNVVSCKEEEEVMLDIRNMETFKYWFVYYDRGDMTEIESEEFTLTDVSDYEDAFYSAQLLSGVNFEQSYFTVLLDFSDEFYVYHDIQLTLQPHDDGLSGGNFVGDPCIFELDHVNGEQIVSYADFEIDPSEGTWDYEITYFRGEDETQLTAGSDTAIGFYISDPAMFFNFETDFLVAPSDDMTSQEYYLPIKLNYVDKQHQYNDFYLCINGEGEIPLRVVPTWQYVSIQGYEQYVDSDEEVELRISATLYNYMTHETETEVYGADDQVKNGKFSSQGVSVYGITLNNPTEIVHFGDAYLLEFGIVINDPSKTQFGTFQLIIDADIAYYYDMDLSNTSYINGQYEITLNNEQYPNIMDILEYQPADIILRYEAYSGEDKETFEILIYEDTTFYVVQGV